MTATQEPIAAEHNVWRELEPILDQEFNRMSEKYRIPILLCDLGGSTLKEAATELGWPQGTLSTRLTKARAILARRLTRHGFTLSAGALAVLITQHATAAGVPAKLVATTLQLAGAIAVGQGVPAGAAASNVVALAQGTMASMFFIKVKIAAAITAALAAALFGLQLQRENPSAANSALKAEVQLPPEVRQALENNAAQMNPISISFTAQTKSRLPDKETYELLKISERQFPSQMFQEQTSQVILQGRKFYWSVKGIGESYSEEKGITLDMRQNECSFDGDILYRADLGEDRKKQVAFSKLPISDLLKPGMVSPEHFIGSLYFAGYTGFSSPGVGKDRDAVPGSIVLEDLEQGGKLISVENIALDGRPQVKLQMFVENPDKAQADQANLKDLEQAYKSEKFTDEEREQRLKNIVLLRTLPAQQRIVYYLDPELHYAVRQKEVWYDPETLLLRSRCQDFVQLPGRQLWLPRKYEITYHSYQTVPGVIFKEPFLSHELRVTEMSGDAVPDDKFVLNYTPSEDDGTAKAVLAEIESRKHRSGVPPAAANNRSSRNWLLIANVVAILFLGVFFAYRRFAK